MFKNLKREEGFTLIELLVVIVIIGILIAVAAPSFLGQQNKAKDSNVKQNLAVAAKAIKASTVDSNPAGSYPADEAAARTAITGSEPSISVSGTDADNDAGNIAANSVGVVSSSASGTVLVAKSSSGKVYHSVNAGAVQDGAYTP